MVKTLLSGVIFKADKKPNDTIGWSWGRDNFKTVPHVAEYNTTTMNLFNTTAKSLGKVMNSKDPASTKSTKIKNIKNHFLEKIKPYEKY